MTAADALRTIGDYELFLYEITNQFPCVRVSSVVLVRRGASLARVAGELRFDLGFRLVVRERLIDTGSRVVIDWYGYEAWRGDEKLFWCDPQPHPDDPSLASTQPHHRHVPPDMKHNRVPDPEMSFVKPNIPALIADIEVRLGRTGT